MIALLLRDLDGKWHHPDPLPDAGPAPALLPPPGTVDCPDAEAVGDGICDSIVVVEPVGESPASRLLPPNLSAASIQNAVPEMVRLPAGSRARSFPVHSCARNVLSCRWIHPLRTDGERAITAFLVRVFLPDGVTSLAKNPCYA